MPVSNLSVNTDALGMREMQQRVFAKRDAQHLLVKAPPASGKSRALMFVALDKLYNQGRKKVIVAVPERSIGASFSSTKLTSNGFFADWEIKDEHNLCDPGSSQGKVGAFIKFLDGSGATLVCTHATLRFAFEKLAPEAFNGAVLAIDEFHHVSADTEANRLGALLREVMNGSDVHIVAMTGSYFRGDSVPVLSAEDEARFMPVTFNYYDQLNGYEHLHSLGIGHHFYQGRYTDAIGEVLHLDKKTIVHIPNVNSGESTKDKIEEVGFIIDAIGHVEATDPETGIISIRHKDTGEILRVADLVDDTDQKKRADTLHYLAHVASKERDGVDIIIALGMAKEGFDWPFAEHALTVGYRASLTEVIQIIGRVTRDSPGKEHAQFTNLIAEPDATQSEVKVSVNNMLKAITASLLMEQVLAQNFTFKTKRAEDDDVNPPGVIKIKGFKEPSSERVKQIVETDLNDLKATILQDDTFAKAAAGSVDPETTNKVLIPKIIRERYPDLDETQVEELRQQVVVDSVIKNGEIREVGDKRFIKMAEKFVNIDDININLIDSVNPFQRAFEVMSKSVTPSVLRIIQDTITATRVEVTEEEALAWTPVSYRCLETTKGVQYVLVGFQLLVLGWFAVAAFSHVANGSAFDATAISPDWFNPFAVGSFSAFAAGVSLSIFIYWGWDVTLTMNEETKNPEKTPGRAATVTVVVIVVIYMTVALATLSFAGVGETGLGVGNPENQSSIFAVLSGPVMGPFAIPMSLAILSSSAASLQSTFVSPARTLLAMGHYKALPQQFGKVSPRYASPAYATVAAAGAAAAFYVITRTASENALWDTITALGMMICFYYGITALACVWFFRAQAFSNGRAFFFKVLSPLLGGVILLVMFFKTVYDSMDPAYGSGSSVGGLGLVFILGMGVILLGVAIMQVMARLRPEFFKGQVLARGN